MGMRSESSDPVTLPLFILNTETFSMLHLNGFSAWITVDHEPLPIYAVEIGGQQNLATCWVPSTLGKVKLL
jgi:hypothetical protein